MSRVPSTTRQWILDHHPQKDERPSQFFKLIEIPLPGPGELADKNAVIIKPLLLSNDPSQRTWVGAEGSYITVKLGQVMKSWGVGKVVESYKDGFKKGELVWGMLGWDEYMLFEDPATQYPPGLSKLTEEQARDPGGFIALRLTGLTAYYGLLKCGEATSTDHTIVVSTAAGSTGAMVVQIAKHVLKIPNIIGITGSEEKMSLIKSLGCDVALNYKSPTFEADLGAATPKGIDLYFDNVGGAMLDMMLRRMRTRGRIVACGAIGSYDNDNSDASVYVKELRRIIMSGVRIQGLNVTHHAADFPNGLRELEGWLREGKVKSLTTEFETGFEGVPMGMERLLSGKNTGKLLTKIV
ncbi:hypothetical protein BGX38DRAFT_1175857 [Terfezia claveryi]|nr:hypothetical protein BGX38DRAFT_1175857 [Terfezia claveryi]